MTKPTSAINTGGPLTKPLFKRNNSMAAKNSTLTQERLKELFHYDPETGIFIRKVRISYRSKVGEIAGGFDASTGYVRISILGELYYSHRLVWLYVTGVWPKKEIDHINGNRSDNRLCNLREATKSENRQNISADGYKTNSCGFLGVFLDKSCNRWRAKIEVNKCLESLGSYSTAEEASIAYAQAKARLHTFNPVPR